VLLYCTVMCVIVLYCDACYCIVLQCIVTIIATLPYGTVSVTRGNTSKILEILRNSAGKIKTKAPFIQTVYCTVSSLATQFISTAITEISPSPQNFPPFARHRSY
jgi:hypothetical protein